MRFRHTSKCISFGWYIEENNRSGPAEGWRSVWAGVGTGTSAVMCTVLPHSANATFSETPQAHPLVIPDVRNNIDGRE